MKKTRIIIPLLFAFISVYLFSCTSLFFFPDRSKCMVSEGGLTKTHWKQMGGFEKYTPDSLRLGCWSTALAQIVYYHKLKPYGHIAYTSRNGYVINETVDSTLFDLNLFTPVLDSTTPDQVADQIARYNYYAALAVQKDFGTDRYMNKLASASLLEQHYQMKVHRYISWRRKLPYTSGKLEEIIYREINQQRPVFLHFANLEDFGHSIVVDGYCYEQGKFMIHTNQGQGGPTDGWYDFYKGILKNNDQALRVIYTFKPL